MGDSRRATLEEETPSDPQVLKARGNEAFRSKDYNQAIILWRDALSLYPEPVEACIPLYSNIAGALLLIGDFQGCCSEATAGIDCFQRGLECSRHLRGKLLVRRAEAQDHLGNWERALRDYTEGIALWDESSTSISRKKANKLYHKIFGGPEYPFVEEKTTGKYLAFGPDRRRQALVFRPRPHPSSSSSPPSRIHMTHWSHEDNLYCWGGILLDSAKRDEMHVVPQDPQALFVYSALTGEWREVQPTANTFFPNPRASGAAVVWEGCCYMHSGKPKIGPPGDRNRYSKWGMLSVWQLDLSTLKWTEYWKFNDPKKEVKKKRNIPIARTYEAPACAVTGTGKMLEWGGCAYDFNSILNNPDYGVTNLLRIFDIPSKTWSTVQGTHSSTGAPLPAPRQFGVGWVHENYFFVFGGHWEKNTGTKIPLDYATNNLDRYDLRNGGWESIPMMGDHPPPLQEAGCVPACSLEMAAKLPDGRPAVFIFGGYLMNLNGSLAPYGLDPARWPPSTLMTSYHRDHYRLDLNTLHWSRLHQVGNVRPLGIAQPLVFAPASAPHRLVLTQGYGFHPLRTEEAELPEVPEAGPTLVPVVFDNTFDVYPSACPLTEKGVLCPVSGARQGAGEEAGIWYRSPHQAEPQWVDWRGLTVPPEDEQLWRESGWTNSDSFGPRKLFVVEYKEINRECKPYFDTYFGPSAKVLREILTTRFRKGVGGILSRDGYQGLFRGEVCLEDSSKVPALFRGTPQRDELLAAWIQARAARQQALGEALTETYRGRRQQRVRGLVLLVELRTTRPRVWRRVRVGSRLTLRQLHDVVLCPAVGWQRACHSYAFRELRPGERHDDDSVVWFGNPGEGQERTVDMSQVPFFYGGALVNDKDLVVDSMFEGEGSRLAYVYDLGQYWWHSITLESYCTEDSVALLDGWGQAVPEDTSGGSWNYCSLLSELLLDTPVLPNQSPLSVNDWWAKYWDLLDATNNVGTPATFDPCHFDLELHQRKLAEALRSRISKYDGRFNPVPGTNTAKAAARGGSINRNHLHVNDPLPEARLRCAVCGVGAGLHGCAGCRLVYYCSKEHQKAHWKEHKPTCASTANKKKEKKQEAPRRR